MSPRTILVTGAASGIGLALVQRLVNRGDVVIALDRRRCPVDGVPTVVCDLASSTDRERAPTELPDVLHGVASVAGVPGIGTALEVLTINLLAPRALLNAVADRLVPGAAVVTVASIAASRCVQSPEAIDELLAVDSEQELAKWLERHPIDGSAAYDTSKHALVRWTAALASQWIPTGRRAVSVSPGPVETPILGDFASSMGQTAIDRSAQTVGRHGRPEEVAAVIEFALSTDASWLNGIDIAVDGGLRAARAHSPS